MVEDYRALILRRNGLFIALFSVLTVLLLALGAYLTSRTTALEMALGYASYGASLISLLGLIYVGAARFLKNRAGEWAKRELREPMGFLIMASSPKTTKQIMRSIEDLEKRRDFFEKYF